MRHLPGARRGLFLSACFGLVLLACGLQFSPADVAAGKDAQGDATFLDGSPTEGGTREDASANDASDAPLTDDVGVDANDASVPPVCNAPQVDTGGTCTCPNILSGGENDRLYCLPSNTCRASAGNCSAGFRACVQCANGNLATWFGEARALSVTTLLECPPRPLALDCPCGNEDDCPSNDMVCVKTGASAQKYCRTCGELISAGAKCKQDGDCKTNNPGVDPLHCQN